MSSPSTRAIGWSVALWCACQFQPAWGTKPPRFIGLTADDRSHAGSLDHESERVLDVPVLGRVLARHKVLDRGPQRRRGEWSAIEAGVGQRDRAPFAAAPDISVQSGTSRCFSKPR
nr:hypothetical protein [Nocardia farcinica]